MEPLISIIVPIYNVEKYLNRCIESIVNQTYKNLEIILVDDGSPDNCPQICDEWKEKDNRIVVIHKENGGLSDARNAGLNIAQGEYIAFVDSDDWIDKNYLFILYKAVDEKDADLSVCNLKMVYESQENIKDTDETVYELQDITHEQAMYDILHGQGIRAVAWNKLYKRNLIIEERFKKGKIHEDEFFTYKIVDKANKIIYIDVPLYNYFQRKNSIMSTVSIKHLDFLEALNERLFFIEKKYPQFYLEEKISFCIACINHYKKTFISKSSDNEVYRKKIKQYRDNISFNYDEFNNVSIKHKIYILFSKHFLFLFSYILYLKGGRSIG